MVLVFEQTADLEDAAAYNAQVLSAVLSEACVQLVVFLQITAASGALGCVCGLRRGHDGRLAWTL